jgi:hypothetical protein
VIEYDDDVIKCYSDEEIRSQVGIPSSGNSK